VQNAWVADPDRVRNFRPGQAAWIRGNACTHLHVAPWRRPPRALGPTRRELVLVPVPAQLPAGHEASHGPAGPEVPLPEGASR
jgi:hypothetical protein